jgi:hypothetical protein
MSDDITIDPVYQDYTIPPYIINDNIVTGSPGQVYTITGSNGTSANWTTISADPNLQGATLDVKGDANFSGDVKIKGKSIADSLNLIEEKLAILHPNDELEEKWESLRGLRKAYMELEAEIKEKELIWATLKK